MNPISPDHHEPLDPAAARLLARVRRTMVISAAALLIALAAVFGTIGYRVSLEGGSAAPAEQTATLPKGSRILNTAVGDGRIVVTIDNAGTVELRSFDLKTLRPRGRLQFTTEP